MLFEGCTGITCPRECHYMFPNTTFTSLWMSTGRSGVATVLCLVQAWRCTATPARDKRQLHINVLELGEICLTPLHLEEEVLSQTS